MKKSPDRVDYRHYTSEDIFLEEISSKIVGISRDFYTRTIRTRLSDRDVSVRGEPVLRRANHHLLAMVTGQRQCRWAIE
jgi:hypothetical protein